MAVAQDVAAAAGAPLPQAGPGPVPAGWQSLAKQRQKGMHLDPEAKKRKAVANGYASMVAGRGRSSLLTALIGAAALQAGVPALDKMAAVCCKGGCPSRQKHGMPACIMAVGGYGHLENLHVEHLRTEADMVDRQKKHNGVFGGKVKNTGPVAERRSRLQGLLDKAIWCEQIAPEGSGQKHKYGSRYTVPHSNGQLVVV